MTRSREGRRLLLMAAYLAITGAGITAFVSGWGGLIAGALGWSTLAWASFITVGGAAAALGIVTQRWLGELTGLPAMYASVGLLGALLTVFNDGRLVRVSFGLLTLGLACMLGARWQRVLRLAHDDRDLERRRVGGELP